MESEDYFVAHPPPSPAEASEAGLALRCAAFLFDYILTLLIPALTLVTAVYIKRQWQAPGVAGGIVIVGYLAAAALIFFNFGYLYVLDGRSFGKRLIGIRVVRTDGRPLDYQTALLRHLVGYPLSVLCLMLGALWALWDPKQQTWHDKLAKTIVIRD
jgi:uncharacterized RDD family membrane protein YckC